MMKENPEMFRELVEESLCRQVRAINKLAARGMKFWDYGMLVAGGRVSSALC
jgi:urocanate hydratase